MKRRPPLALLLVVVVSTGCAFAGRTVGMHDPTIDIVQALAESQAASIRALTDALSKASVHACAAPTAEVK